MKTIPKISQIIRSIPLVLVLLLSACDASEEIACKADDGNDVNLNAISLKRVNGDVENFAPYLDKVLVINIWATWCGPCVKEMPSLQRLSDRLPGDIGSVVGISVDRKSEDVVQGFLDEHNISFTNYVDPKQTVTRALFEVSSLPETFIFGPSGCLIDRIVGIREWDSDEMLNRLTSIMTKKDD